MFSKIVIFLVTSITIYFAIALILILLGMPEKPSVTDHGLAFNELLFDPTGLPALQTYTARDNAKLSYREYPAPSNTVMILLHGSGWHSRYFFPLSQFISDQRLARVYTPDLRGHGHDPARRGDIDYIGQLEDDLADFLAMIRKDHPRAKVIIGGHSSGGGLVIRFAGSPYGRIADAYLLLAPFLKYNAPTMRPGAGGWALPYTGRIIGLTMLNNIGIHGLDHLPAIAFNLPGKFRDGTETLAYSHRLNTAYAPRNYQKDLSAIKQPLLVVIGKNDDAFIADQFEPVMSSYTDLEVELLAGTTHMGVVVGDVVRPVIQNWLVGLDGK